MPSKWLTRRAVLSTLAIVVWAPGCLVAGWWQATVAMSGNTLSYLYAVEWPAFAVFGVIVWWHLVHDDPDSVGARGLARLRALAESARAAAATEEAGHSPSEVSKAWPPADLPPAAATPVAPLLETATPGAPLCGGQPATHSAATAAPQRSFASASGPRSGTPPRAPTELRRADEADEADDEEVRAYNEYLASLRDRPKTWSRR